MDPSRDEFKTTEKAKQDESNQMEDESREELVRKGAVGRRFAVPDLTAVSAALVAGAK